MEPPAVADEAALPKFISTVFAMLMGATMLAATEAMAVLCAALGSLPATTAINKANKYFLFMMRCHFR
jgi:hypothetical protein